MTIGTERRKLLVTGLVQGVGFRPFVANLAARLNLTGTVSNTGRGVEIEIQGESGSLELFSRLLKEESPTMAVILKVEESPAILNVTEEIFSITSSRIDAFSSVIVPPDIAVCPDCLRELNHPSDRRHGYPFTNCTNCGPRYTIIEEIPYDRERTSMKGFAMCENCRAEFEDHADRRFHAQPNACPVCGPKLALLDSTGVPVKGDPLPIVRQALSEGKTVALMGLGGIHLACDAANDRSVLELRRRKKRPGKPFAVMAADMESALDLAHIDGPARDALLSARAPIVLCPAREQCPLAPSVAPGQSAVGIFLPYTPLHHLLFAAPAPRHLVMTSGNRSDEPIISTAERALEELAGVADLFLFHDRPIIHAVDDSVMKSFPGSAPVMIRRARGYAPAPLFIPAVTPPVLALGAELLVTATVLNQGMAFVGPHAGDLKNPETEDGYRRAVEHLLGLLKVRPEIVVSDLHPDYRSSVMAREFAAGGARHLTVQHHEAHASSVMAENGFFDGEGLCLVLDGVGLGRDGSLWGGELLAGKIGAFRRAGRLLSVRQPGGDKAAREPWRMAASWMREIHGPSWTSIPLPCFVHRDPGDLSIIDSMLSSGMNSPLTSSCGRLFDAAAAILGFSGAMNYTAQAPMELEGIALKTGGGAFPPYPAGGISNQGGMLVLDPRPLLAALAEDALNGVPAGEAALAFHKSLALSFVLLVEMTSMETGIKNVFLSGGCMQNAVLVEEIRGGLVKRGLAVHTHREIPPNDGGISFGQAAHAASVAPHD